MGIGLGVLGGAIVGGLFGKSGQDSANRANSAMSLRQMQYEHKEARYQRDFQKTMSDSAVNRRMKDMKNAGINPILASKYDATTPAGAMGKGSMPTMQNSAAAAMKSANDAMQMGQAFANMRKTMAEANVIESKGPGADIKEDFMEGAKKIYLNLGDKKTSAVGAIKETRSFSKNVKSSVRELLNKKKPAKIIKKGRNYSITEDRKYKYYYDKNGKLLQRILK